MSADTERNDSPNTSRGNCVASESIKDVLRAKAHELGFDAVGFTSPEIGGAGARLQQFLDAGTHGDMGWLAAKRERRADPRVLWPEVQTIIVLGVNYGPAGDPLEPLTRRERGTISVYALGRDYHDVVKGRLKQLAGWLQAAYGGAVKVFVDTAPVMEKPLAERAGIGWQGKHTNLVSRQLGSWLFLGEIFTTLVLPPDAAEEDHCGSCQACLDICPTRAFPAPYQLDARRCLSYLTIEHKGPIPREFRKAMGNRIYGCDDCLAVCPWNKFAVRTKEYAFLPRAELTAPRLADLAQLDDAAFRQLFAGAAIKRTGRDRFVRNVLIALGNSGDAAAIPIIERLLADAAPLVRGAAVWALAQLADPPSFERLRQRFLPAESDAAVRAEWHEAAAVSAA
ncbi:MAG TPA: tRNA epoxyqueuosine(34) reductase QueG [Methylomirabilota bacterium]|nr:tRNA epoxyqueuosine(34) reductase QueG [Methylomirabilota bacterium]